MKKVEAGIYKHFKGDLYEVLGEARHTETGEVFVIYRPEEDKRTLCARPRNNFFEEVERGDYKGPRFKKLL